MSEPARTGPPVLLADRQPARDQASVYEAAQASAASGHVLSPAFEL